MFKFAIVFVLFGLVFADVQVSYTEKEKDNFKRENVGDLKSFFKSHNKLHSVRLDYKDWNGVLEDGTFGDAQITRLIAAGLKKVGAKIFDGKLASSVTDLRFGENSIAAQPSNYDIWKALSSLKKIEKIEVGVNTSELPAKVMTSSSLDSLMVNLSQPVTVKTGALEGLSNLTQFTLWDSSIKKIEKGAFKTASKSNNTYKIHFLNSKISGKAFDNGTFDGVLDRQLDIGFWATDIDYIPESAFKPVLEKNPKNKVYLSHSWYTECYLDCTNCGNFWLVRDKKNSQFSAYCQGQMSKTLFDEDIKLKLFAYCK